MSQLKRLSLTKAFFKITLFFGKFLGLSLWDILYYVTTTFSRFLKDVFWIILEIRYLLLRSNYVHKYDLITLRVRFSFLEFFCVERLHNVSMLCFAFVFIVRCFLLRQNHVIYLFDVLTLFDNVRTTLYFVIFELRMEIMSQLRFAIARHCDVFFITSKLRYLFLRFSYVFWWR